MEQDSREEFKTLLEEIKKTEDENRKYAKKHYHMSMITAICAVIAVAILMMAYNNMAPKIMNAVDEMQAVAEKLNEVDLVSIADNIDRMALTSEESVRKSAEKIEEIDIDELNRAIKGLSDVVTPFADFMNFFKGDR